MRGMGRKRLSEGRMTTTTFYLPFTQLARLNYISDRTEIPVAALIRRAIDRELMRHHNSLAGFEDKHVKQLIASRKERK